MSCQGMKRWVGRVAVVTGASEGTIGGAIATDLVRHGMTVIGCARNVSQVEKLLEKKEVAEASPGKLVPYKCDLSNPEEIGQLFSKVKADHGGVDVMINNAGISSMKPLLAIEWEDMKSQVDLNVMSLTMCCKYAVNSMLERGVSDGHVVNMNSMLGHQVYGQLNFYAGTKWAVTAITEGLRKEIAQKGSKIKVTQVSPGRVETNFLYRSFGEGGEGKAKAIYESGQSLVPQDVSDAVIHALAAAPHVQVQDILMTPIDPTPQTMLK